MGLSTRIFIGLFAGILTGLFFGEIVADLKIVGDIFIKLLQMTVLPYIVVSLIAGFGRMNSAQARRLALRGSAVLGVIWLLALVLIFLAPLAFPTLETASFFSSPVQASASGGDLFDLYLPSNIFYSLSNNFVPAVVLFSIFLGVALIAVEDKSSILPVFDSLTVALAGINAMIVRLTPYGIFAIASAAAGTMTIEELSRVQVYLITYIALSLVITFWIFPGLVSAVSGIPYREVLSTFKDALVTAFATGNQFVVLPLIAENCKSLLAKYNLPEEESRAAIDVIVPVSFNFPSLGKMLVLLFVLFAAWFTDTELDMGQRLDLAFNGLFSLFGSINVAVPFLLDNLRIPNDMFQLFMVTGVVVGRFGAMLAALHIIVLSVIGTLAMCGQLKMSWHSVGRYLAISGATIFLLLIGLRAYFSVFVPPPPDREQVLEAVALQMERVPTKVRSTPKTIAAPLLPGQRFDHILRRGTLRVGYRPANLPCTYLNKQGNVVGLDADMAHSLAQDLGLELRLIPFTFDDLGPLLQSGQLDIAMSCIASLPDRYAQAAYSRSYLDLHTALIVPDHMRAQFSGRTDVREDQELSIALVSSHYFAPRIAQMRPNARIVNLESAEEFFSGDQPPADALLLSAEEGAAYAFRYPKFTVVLPKQSIIIPAAYALPRGEIEWHQVVSNWVDLKRKDGSVDALREYWLQGGVTENNQPRWSVIRDVLGWVD
jgi:Na+/H+-dicarboxylate symporter/ABC-type amino acid transport substrate-binding protein